MCVQFLSDKYVHESLTGIEFMAATFHSLTAMFAITRRLIASSTLSAACVPQASSEKIYSPAALVFLEAGCPAPFCLAAFLS